MCSKLWKLSLITAWCIDVVYLGPFYWWGSPSLMLNLLCTLLSYERSVLFGTHLPDPWVRQNSSTYIGYQSRIICSLFKCCWRLLIWGRVVIWGRRHQSSYLNNVLIDFPLWILKYRLRPTCFNFLKLFFSLSVIVLLRQPLPYAHMGICEFTHKTSHTVLRCVFFYLDHNYNENKRGKALVTKSKNM